MLIFIACWLLFIVYLHPQTQKKSLCKVSVLPNAINRNYKLDPNYLQGDSWCFGIHFNSVVRFLRANFLTQHEQSKHCSLSLALLQMRSVQERTASSSTLSSWSPGRRMLQTTTPAATTLWERSTSTLFLTGSANWWEKSRNLERFWVWGCWNKCALNVFDS